MRPREEVVEAEACGWEAMGWGQGVVTKEERGWLRNSTM